jgi:Flp pilus assembly protein TadG
VRVLLKRQADERGVTTILVALLAVSLLVMAGFVLDFGQAYMSKRNLQKAADAGALAGAQALTKYPGTCANVTSNSTALGEAHAAADEYRKKNRESYLDPSIETEFLVRCDPALKVLVVEYGVKGDTQSFFGPLVGSSSSITTDRRAEATVDVAPMAKQAVRPLAFCSAQLPPPAPTEVFVRIDYPKNSVNPPPGCPAKTGPGNWWTLDCPEEATGSTSQMVDQILNGCDEGVSVVPGQEDTLTEGELTVRLEAECDAGSTDSETCLGGDPGNIDAGQVVDAWKTLVQDETESIFPVFCAPPQCSESTTEGEGANATYPVYKMIATVICGYHFSKTERYHSSSGLCSGLPTTMHAGNDDSGNEANYLVIKYINMRTSGSNKESECALGAECDGGLRRTRLTG